MVSRVRVASPKHSPQRTQIPYERSSSEYPFGTRRKSVKNKRYGEFYCTHRVNVKLRHRGGEIPGQRRPGPGRIDPVPRPYRPRVPRRPLWRPGPAARLAAGTISLRFGRPALLRPGPGPFCGRCPNRLPLRPSPGDRRPCHATQGYFDPAETCREDESSAWVSLARAVEHNPSAPLERCRS